MTEKLSKARVTLELDFLDGVEEEGFNIYDALHAWAAQTCGFPKDQNIFLGDYMLESTTPFVELKPLKLTIPGRDEPRITTKEDEEQYRCSNPKKITQTGFARYVLKRFGVTYEIYSPD